MTDWSESTPEQIARALRTIPKLVAYAWRLDEDGNWVRDDVMEYGCAWAAHVRPVAGGWQANFGAQRHDTAEEAKAATDAALRADGWILCETLLGGE